MISYKVKGIILAVIISLASIMMPFSVYADTISNNNVHINYYLDSVTEVSTGTYLQTYKVDFIFDQSYLGWISTKMVGTYVNNNTVPVTTSQFSYTKSIYVNGSIASTTVSFTTPNNISNGALQSLSQSIQNSSVTPLADLSTLDDILNVLTDIQNTLNINVMDDLDQILIDVGLASDYLETLTKMKQYNFPIESFNYIYQFFSDFQYEPVDLLNFNYWSFPIYDVRNKKIAKFYLSSTASFNDYLFIFGFSNQSISSPSQLLNFMSFSSESTTIENISFTNLNRLYFGAYYSIYSVIIHYSSGSSGETSIIANNNIAFSSFLPIYLNKSTNKYLSTDFALQFGLSNQLLDNIQTIANGTQQSNSAASDLESEASEYSEIADDVIGVEEGLTSNFETEVNKIDLNTGLNVFGGNFMTSATWVRTQFDRLTENTPYGSLVVYGLTLGFALLMLGKVFL